MTKHQFNLANIHSTWLPHINEALSQVDTNYLDSLIQEDAWLPGTEKIFNAFTLPIDKVKYVLFGESPYPRMQSANGYAFWDDAVTELWTETGLSKKVNRATSLRNIIKMLLVADNLLTPDSTTQEDIAKINKYSLVKTNTELFTNFLNHGFLLLNISLVLQDSPVKKDALAWHPFIQTILNSLIKINPNIQLILLGKVANDIDQRIKVNAPKLYAEHPYNLSFIQNKAIIDFFKPLQLLKGY